jgi:ribosomal protein S10
MRRAVLDFDLELKAFDYRDLDYISKFINHFSNSLQ